MKMNRQIGYIKSESTPEVREVINTGTKPVQIEDISKMIGDRSKGIVNWIKSRPAIKWTVICKDAGVDKGNFQRILKSDVPYIKMDNIIKIETELKKYGYK